MWIPYSTVKYPETRQTAPTVIESARTIEAKAADAWTDIVVAGTGGTCTVTFLRDRCGYRFFPIVDRTSGKHAEASRPYAQLMAEIKEGFGRTMTRLPVVFGVSRQTLYNWLNGEMPKESHHAKIVELAAAARTFALAGFKPTPAMLDRTVTRGKSFLALLGEGANGASAAGSLIRIVNRGLRSREALDAAFAGKSQSRPDVSDIGAPAFDEDA